MDDGKKVKILTVAPLYRFFIKEFVEALSKQVEEVNVLIHHNYLAELAPFIPIPQCRHIEKFSRNNLIDRYNTPQNIIVRILSTIYFIPDGKNVQLGDELLRKFNECVRRHKIEFDLIHAHFTWPSGYAAVKLAKMYNVPAVVTIHENDNWLLREHCSNNNRIHWTWKNADALIRVNKKDVPLLEEYNEDVFYVPNGFNPNKFLAMEQSKSREFVKLPKNSKIIFTYSNLIERKGFQYLIDSMNHIRKRRDDVLCFIGGSGPMKWKLGEQIKELGLEDCVKVLGFVPDDHLVYWMNAADLFVLPSLNEGNPTVMFEALGCGKPFVGTNVGGIPEIIESEDYGLLCNPADSKALAKNIMLALRKQWDEEKIRNYSEQYTWENIAKRTLKVYMRLLKPD